ncbi:unnamed protein product [Rotaria magnacalcarata]
MQQKVLQNLKYLPKFESIASRKIYYINRTTTWDTITKLIKLAKETNRFVMEIKYGYKDTYPALIQILSPYKMQFFVVFVETKHLPWLDLCLHAKIEPLFSLFLDHALFKSHQIDRIRVVSIQQKSRQWLQKTLGSVELKHALFDHWTLQTAMAFIFQEYLDTTLSKSHDWDIGLYLEFDPGYVEKLIHRDTFVCNLQAGHYYRSIHKLHLIYTIFI